MEKTDLLSVVRAETHQQHQQLESVLPLSNPSLSAEDYKEVLKVFLGIFEPLEHALRHVELPGDLEFEKRTRTKLLKDDLQALGLTAAEISAIPRFEGLSAFPSPAHAMGVMYVLEGSTLGGQHVTRLLHDRIGLNADSGCSFFSSHGRDVGSMWKKFCEVVRHEVVVTRDREEFVNAAKWTFSSFEMWAVSRCPNSLIT
jgi:heme oxygenase